MIDTKIRAWILSFPGLFTGATPQSVLSLAHEECCDVTGLICTADEFTTALNRSGYRVDAVGGSYRLCFPEAPIETASHFTAKRLLSIRDRLSGMT